MDGGTYNNVVRTNSPFSPAPTTTPNAYKANVNRTKTRKWVEAKQNNYDGDDWGNDFDDEDEEDEPAPPPVQRAPTGGLLSSVRSVSTPLQVRGNDANDAFGRRSFGDPGANPMSSQQRGNIASPIAARNDPFPPTNRIQPVYAANAPSDMQSPQGSGPQPFSSHTRTDSLQAGTSFPPRKSSMSNVAGGNAIPSYGNQPEYGANSQVAESQPLYTSPTSPQEAATSAGKPKKFVRPADIYKRVGEEREKERLSMDSSRPSLDDITGRGSGANSPTMLRTSGEQRRRASLDKSDVGDAGNPGEKAALPTVAEAKNEIGLNKAVTSQTLGKGDSTSPKLPEVSRMSMFGDDFFSTNIRETSTPVSTTIAPIEESKPLEKSHEKALPETAASPSKLSEASRPEQALQEDTSAETASSAKKTVHGHLARPSLPGGWVSETTNVESATPTPTPMENPLETAQFESSTPSQTTASVDTAAKGHFTPQSLPPLNTQGGSAPTRNILPEQQAAKSAASDQAPKFSTDQESPVSYAPSSAAASIPSYGDNVPPLGPPRKSTLSSVATASPLKESDMLSDEIMKSLSPAVDASGNPSRSGPSKLSSQDTPEDPHLSRSLSGIYDDYYGFQEDKMLGDGGQILKNDTQTSQDTPKLGSEALATSTAQKSVALPEIRPLSPNKKGTEPQTAIQSRERRFSFDAGPENVTLSPVEAPDSSAVSFGSMEDRQPIAQPEYKEAAKPAANTAPARETTPVQGPAASQLQPQNQTITHQVSQMSIGVSEDIDLNQIDQPSPISTAKSATPVGSPQIPIEDKVLLPPDARDVKASEPGSAPDADVSSITSSHKNDPALAPVETVTPTAAVAPAQKIMPFREILVIGSPQQRIAKFDETRSQFFHTDTGLGDWLHHMQLQSDPGAAGVRDAGAVANEVTSPANGQPAQQPYYQQYLNASNPNLNMPPPNRSNTGNLMSPAGGQGASQGLPNSSFNPGAAGVKGKELLQAAGVLGNKGMKTGMKFFNKSKTKLRERGDKVFN